MNRTDPMGTEWVTLADGYVWKWIRREGEPEIPTNLPTGATYKKQLGSGFHAFASLEAQQAFASDTIGSLRRKQADAMADAERNYLRGEAELNENLKWLNSPYAKKHEIVRSGEMKEAFLDRWNNFPNSTSRTLNRTLWSIVPGTDMAIDGVMSKVEFEEEDDDDGISEASMSGATGTILNAALNSKAAIRKKLGSVWGRVTSDTLRAQARASYGKVYPSLMRTAERMAERSGQNLLEIHHRIPLEYRKFFKGDPNRISNLVGLHKDVHAEISGLWTAFRSANPHAKPADIMQFASKIDDEYSALYNTLNVRKNLQGVKMPAFR